MAIDYKKSGVDIDAGDSLVEWLQSNRPQSWPHQERLVSGIGGFAALFKADFKEMKEPCLVSCTDGVGTKVKIASQFGRYEGIGQDLVGMCVNDMICCGAEPLFFLDYYACGKLQLDKAKAFLKGLQTACLNADCALIGGETAEMPGVYEKDDFDCAGFSVGVVDRSKILGSQRVNPGDHLLGISSNGFHSNGYSLLRKIFAEDMQDHLDMLMRPTHLYVRLARQLKQNSGLHALAHITGGGMDNIPRVLPPLTRAQLKPWAMPSEFREVQKRSGMGAKDILRTLNCGIGLVAVCESNVYQALAAAVTTAGFKAYDLGEVVIGKSEETDWDMDLQGFEKLNS